ncbi:NADH dehydrogenase [ubiquinone] 1 beta subcomplex subunit 10-like [Amphibalanus amphitrite]|uniref:NADH dehydrogenase [ubiquinone] 1 beta subcomplex subunit 10-like n=1 Tax=Amphibalanus amphitrite TaxID=1232801 RepID=UPI001C916308|nr:NADH dehydrogenase [ubiquinone] 1 beta subcomplex subunit 10-like [Amphibalanus amphitrite]
MTDPYSDNLFTKFCTSVFNTIDKPVTWFRERVVVPNRKEYPWYHRSYNRVPTIDQCYTDDPVCFFEANEQWIRDRQVDREIVNILRQRWRDCAFYEGVDAPVKCVELQKISEDAETNFFIKYGDLSAYANVKDCYMKQKHRMLWERRHGPVGTGMKTEQ